MKKEIKKKWLAALRSGKYRQAHEWLHITDFVGNESFCCLGVLCDLHANQFKKKWDGQNYLGKVFYLPMAVRKWAGLKDENPRVILNKKEVPLAAMNDFKKKGFEYKYNFRDIANAISKSL